MQREGNGLSLSGSWGQGVWWLGNWGSGHKKTSGPVEVKSPFQNGQPCIAFPVVSQHLELLSRTAKHLNLKYACDKRGEWLRSAHMSGSLPNSKECERPLSTLICFPQCLTRSTLSRITTPSTAALQPPFREYGSKLLQLICCRLGHYRCEIRVSFGTASNMFD